MKKFNWLVLCMLFAFIVGVGCSGMAPNQIRPTQAVELSGTYYCLEHEYEMALGGKHYCLEEKYLD